MAIQTISSSDSGSVAAGKINDNFSEISENMGSGVPDWDLEVGLAYDNAIKQMKSPSSGIYMLSKSVNLLHFSDIHGYAANLERVVAFGTRYADYIDAIIHTGDNVHQNFSDGTSFWTGISGTNKILNCIGNHDSWDGSNWHGKTAAECAAAYITPYVSNWGVTIGSNVCYYYKDFSDQGVRLIVIDVMHYDATQASWLESTLASAKTNSYHVIIASHYPPAKSDWIDCNFDSWHYNYDAPNTYGGYLSSLGVPALVDAFQTGGGVFICYICGHTHVDECRFCQGYPHQLHFCVDTSAISTVNKSYNRRVVGERNQDAMNLYSIRPTEGTLAVLRIGNDMDRAGKHRGGMTYDYINHQIIGQW